MTQDELTLALIKIDALTDLLRELATEKRFTITGKVSDVNAVEQTAGYLHYFKIKNDFGKFTVYYPDSASAAIGEILSSGAFFSVKATPKPYDDLGAATFWIYSADDVAGI